VGKASSSKKVARAAQAGKRVKVRTSRGSIFPVALATVVVLGLALVIWARADRRSSVSNVAPAVGLDHWHVAYGFYICDKFLDPLPTVEPDPLGIHTHGDGVIHIHPFSSSTSGRNAKLGKFFDHENVDMSNTKLKLPDKKGEWSNGDKCGEGDAAKSANLQVAVWENRTDTEPKIYKADFKNIRFDKDFMLMTIAFVPDGTTIPKPVSESVLDNLSDVEPSATTTTAPATTVAGSDTTVTGATTTAGSATTAAGSATTVASATTVGSATTAAPSTTTG
jgi:hypothetical protein